jgi:hypothetical protein
LLLAAYAEVLVKRQPTGASSAFRRTKFGRYAAKAKRD